MREICGCLAFTQVLRKHVPRKEMFVIVGYPWTGHSLVTVGIDGASNMAWGQLWIWVPAPCTMPSPWLRKGYWVGGEHPIHSLPMTLTEWYHLSILSGGEHTSVMVWQFWKNVINASLVPRPLTCRTWSSVLISFHKIYMSFWGLHSHLLFRPSPFLTQTFYPGTRKKKDKEFP